MTENNTSVDIHQYRELKPVGVMVFIMVTGFASVMTLLSFFNIG